ncbi:Peptide synthetase, partial [Pseudomonas coronafaciens pv. garcae]
LNVTAVPLDPGYPLAVQRQILQQARPCCLLYSSATETALAALDGGEVPRHRVDLGAPDKSFERRRHAGERPLYTLFTSGSTG